MKKDSAGKSSQRSRLARMGQPSKEPSEIVQSRVRTRQSSFRSSEDNPRTDQTLDWFVFKELGHQIEAAIAQTQTIEDHCQHCLPQRYTSMHLLFQPIEVLHQAHLPLTPQPQSPDDPVVPPKTWTSKPPLSSGGARLSCGVGTRQVDSPTASLNTTRERAEDGC